LARGKKAQKPKKGEGTTRNIEKATKKRGDVKTSTLFGSVCKKGFGRAFSSNRKVAN